MPIQIISGVSREELINEALRLLHGISGTALPTNSEGKADRRWIEETADEYKTLCELPSISSSRQTLRRMAKKAAELAKLFRDEKDRLILGTATDNPHDTPDRIFEKRREIESVQQDLLKAADDLDQIANWLNGRAATWDGKWIWAASHRRCNGV